MTRAIDKAILFGFIKEVKSYLPAITEGIKSLHKNPHQPEVMEETHRYAHTIKGAASMVGLAGLSHIAYYLEEALEEIAAGQLAMNDETAALLRKTVTQIEGYLDGVLSGTLRERPLLAEITRAYRRLRGLPEEEDEAAVEEVLAEVAVVSALAAEEEERPTTPPMVEVVPYEEVSPELIEAFSLEAEDHLRNISTLLSSLDKQPEHKEGLQDVRRSVHTLKGAAGAVGLRAIAQLAHRMEDLLDLLYAGSLVVDSDIMDLLFASADALEDLVGGEVEGETMRSTLQDLYARYSILLDQGPYVEKLARKLEPLGEEKIIDLAELAPRPSQAVEPETPKKGVAPVPRKPGEVVRVPLEHLDELVRLVSELAISRTVFEQRMADFEREVEELQFSTDRLRRVSSNLETQYEVSALGSRLALSSVGQIGNPSTGLPSAAPSPRLSAGFRTGRVGLSQEATLRVGSRQAFNTHGFDDLEFDRYTEFHLLSRELAETASDIRMMGNELGTLIGDFESILNRQGRLSSELQDKLMQIRMVPLATLATRLHRAVRVLAREQGKLVDLVLEGEDIELDKTVLEEIADPLLHLLRNAVGHGIEPPALRQVLGKPERGLIRLRAYHEGNQVVIQVNDDGAGLEPQILRSVAFSGGYVSEADAPQLSDEDLYSLVFLPGFSTAGEVSEVSGRGVGLDIVKTNVHKLKGTVTLDSTPGQGVTFTIRLPMTLAVTRALLVKAHNEMFAIPLGAVAQILRLEREEIERVGQEPVIRVGEQVYPMLRLGQVLNLKQPADETVQRLPVLILNVEAKQIAVVVDQLLAGREIVIKTLGNHLRQVHGVTGATLMGDGSVVLILNPADLVVEAPQPEAWAWTPPVDKLRTQLQPPAARAREALTVMVVDDSVSVRRVVSNLIKSVGWQPMAAKDGLEALEIMQRSAQPPDLILVDIEMPRMDGYELMSTLKGQEAYRNIPLVILTSRAGEKHRRKALELGASEYIVKPYQDETLLNIIRHLVQESRGAVPA
jgi:chemosensory pili system protein ChpA (sensor histidine kinase/response regulator)